MVVLNNIQPRELANAMRERLQMDDDNDQDILDQHVSRVFSDLTPSKSPGLSSPRPHSPTRARWLRPRRKDKDGVSTFSVDSGNVYDFPEGPEHKSKPKSLLEFEERFARAGASRRSSRKTLTDYTDSGVSVVSETPPVAHEPSRHLLAWLKEPDRPGRAAGYSHSEMGARGHRTGSATSPGAGRFAPQAYLEYESGCRHRKGGGSRSSSQERNGAAGGLGPAPAFYADPSITPPAIPNTSTQLEEARRRLEDNLRSGSTQR